MSPSDEAAAPPMLVMLVGPPAVGKMTVGHELAARTGLRLFHNHQTIDLVLHFFEFGTPPFERLVGEFRRRIFEEVARDLDASRRHLLDIDAHYRLSSNGTFDERADWFRLETTNMSAADAAESIIAHFGLRRAG